MNRFFLAVMAVILGLTAAPASAAELFGGVYKHAVDTPFSLEGGREKGADLQLGVRGKSIVPGAKIEPYALGSVHTGGKISYVAAGIAWKLGDKVFVRPGVGIAVHSGKVQKFDRPDRINLGSRVVFEPEIGVGAQVTPRITVEASWVHLSHAKLAGKQNPGLDSIGVRLSVRL